MEKSGVSVQFANLLSCICLSKSVPYLWCLCAVVVDNFMTSWFLVCYASALPAAAVEGPVPPPPMCLCLVTAAAATTLYFVCSIVQYMNICAHCSSADFYRLSTHRPKKVLRICQPKKPASSSTTFMCVSVPNKPTRLPMLEIHATSE